MLEGKNIHLPENERVPRAACRDVLLITDQIAFLILQCCSKEFFSHHFSFFMAEKEPYSNKCMFLKKKIMKFKGRYI